MKEGETIFEQSIWSFSLEVYNNFECSTENSRRQCAELDTVAALGLPDRVGIKYSLAICMISQGILSGVYHVCPNSTYFQFGNESFLYSFIYYSISTVCTVLCINILLGMLLSDTSFMFLLVMLSMLDLYGRRHTIAPPHSTFVAFAAVVCFAAVGSAFRSSAWFWVVLLLAEFGLMPLISVQLYYADRIEGFSMFEKRISALGAEFFLLCANWLHKW